MRFAAQMPKASRSSDGRAHLGCAVEVRVRHAESAGRHRLEHLLHGRDAGDREGALRGAVVGDRPGDHLVLGRAALQLPVVLRELEGGLDRLAAAGREEHAVEVAGRVAREPVGELDRRGVRVRPDREERQLLGLLRRDLREPLRARAPRSRRRARRGRRSTRGPRVLDVVALASTMIGTPDVSIVDWREKCIQRWSFAFCCSAAVS